MVTNQTICVEQCAWRNPIAPHLTIKMDNCQL